MTLIHLNDPSTGSSASIAAHLGFNCFRFDARLADGREVRVLASAADFEGGGQRPSHSGIPLLFPYPNRIAGARFEWEGRTVQIPAGCVPFDASGNAIHGFCIDRPWRVTKSSEHAVTGSFQLSIDAPDRLDYWPTDAAIEVRYELRGACLRCDVRVTNPSNRPLPWGFGTHPYFQLPLSDRSHAERCRIEAPVHRVWTLTACLPDGSQKDASGSARLASAPEFGGLKLDDVYTNPAIQNGQVCSRLIDPVAQLAVEQRTSADFRELVAFTPSWSQSVCLEPYTCVTNAINLQQQGVDAGLRVLPPGDTWCGWIEIEAVAL